MTSLHSELNRAWRQHVGTGATADRWWHTLAEMHAAPNRHYHNLAHVGWVVRHLSGFARDGHVHDIGATVAAAACHDAIYDVHRADNEHQSAAVAHRMLNELGWAHERIEHVVAMIEVTAHHDLTQIATGTPHGDDTAAFCAADLGVLASGPAAYGDYVRNVRAEYAHVTDADWATGRTRVLDTLLARPRLFASSLQLDSWEQRARANMAAERAALQPDG